MVFRLGRNMSIAPPAPAAFAASTEETRNRCDMHRKKKRLKPQHSRVPFHRAPPHCGALTVVERCRDQRQLLPLSLLSMPPSSSSQPLPARSALSSVSCAPVPPSSRATPVGSPSRTAITMPDPVNQIQQTCREAHSCAHHPLSSPCKHVSALTTPPTDASPRR